VEIYAFNNRSKKTTSTALKRPAREPNLRAVFFSGSGKACGSRSHTCERQWRLLPRNITS
jgi:hypothetical protein